MNKQMWKTLWTSWENPGKYGNRWLATFKVKITFQVGRPQATVHDVTVSRGWMSISGFWAVTTLGYSYNCCYYTK